VTENFRGQFSVLQNVDRICILVASSNCTIIQASIRPSKARTIQLRPRLGAWKHIPNRTQHYFIWQLQLVTSR